MKVTYVDHMGDDLSVVNAARVSFGKKSEYEQGDWKEDEQGIYVENVLKKKDKKLINYLARHNHWTPFAHNAITLHVKAPIFVARQLGKHQVGFVWNEVSRRYVDEEPEFYVPETWRKRAENVKQGSSDESVVLDGNQKCKCCQSEMEFLRPEDKKMKVFCSTNCQAEYYRKKTPEGWARVKAGRIKASAKKRGIPYSITSEDILSLGQPKYCKYLEVELDYEATSLQPNSPSINRIDSTKGYEKGNLEIISNMANSMLLNADKETLKTFIKNVSIQHYGVFFDTAESVDGYYDEMKKLYGKLIQGGLAPEQARMFMPQSQFVEWYWTGNLYGFHNVYKLRTDPHSQKETQEVAHQIGEIIQPLFPCSWRALNESISSM